MRIVVDGAPIEFVDGDSVAVAILRSGAQPAHGGCLCLAGDCGNCVARVDGVAWVRTCQTQARPGTVVARHPLVGNPQAGAPAPDAPTRKRRREADVVIVGGGREGRAEAEAVRNAGRDPLVLDAGEGNEVVAVYPGPVIVVRTPTAVLHIDARDVVIATGAAEVQPVCPGNRLAGILTTRAALQLLDRGVDLGQVAAVGPPPPGVACTAVEGRLVRLVESGDSARVGLVGSVVAATDDGRERTYACDTVIVNLGRSPRDVLARMSDDPAVRVIGSAAEAFPLPACPTQGIVCPCAGVFVDDLQTVWDRGFRDLELMKRASLAGTGTCQGTACVPHVRAFVADHRATVPEPFTARPAARQITLGEAAAGFHVDPFRRTALHEEHLRLGATMDRFGGWWRPWHYGDPTAEYWAVREAVSLGDVSPLGKLIVSGPDVVEFLERLYPTTIEDIRPGRSRYVLLLNERGHVIDDGMVCRQSETRFVLTFTSGGAANAEAWMRDWAETWGIRVHILDRTMALAAINVTGPLAGLLLERMGVAEPPKFLQHRHLDVAGITCHVMRLSFTGEASYELHHSVQRSVELWQALMDAGHTLGVRPHGLKALFGLRLEKGHMIVGADTELDTTPRRIGMDWAVKMDKPYFVGRTALARTEGLPDLRRLHGFKMDGCAPVEGTPIFRAGTLVGQVTSSFTSPVLRQAVMLGWIRDGGSPDGVTIDGRAATLAAAPFYDRAGARARV